VKFNEPHLGQGFLDAVSDMTIQAITVFGTAISQTNKEMYARSKIPLLRK
jgi:hypothetical protein